MDSLKLTISNVEEKQFLLNNEPLDFINNQAVADLRLGLNKLFWSVRGTPNSEYVVSIKSPSVIKGDFKKKLNQMGLEDRRFWFRLLEVEAMNVTNIAVFLNGTQVSILNNKGLGKYKKANNTLNWTVRGDANAAYQIRINGPNHLAFTHEGRLDGQGNDQGAHTFVGGNE